MKRTVYVDERQRQHALLRGTYPIFPSSSNLKKSIELLESDRRGGLEDGSSIEEEMATHNEYVGRQNEFVGRQNSLPLFEHTSHLCLSNSDPELQKYLTSCDRDSPPLESSPKPEKPPSSPDSAFSRVITSHISKTVAHGLAKQYVENTFRHTDITFAGMIDIITDTVQFVETYNTLSGQERKTVVLESIVVYLEHAVKDDAWRDQLIGFVDVVGPHIIDVIVLASKGDLKVNKKTVRKLLSKLSCGCISPNATNP